RSKNSRSFGANSWASRAIARQSMGRVDGPSGGRRDALRGHQRLQALELLGRDPVRVLRPGETAGPDLLGVGLHAADHLLLDLGEALDELRLEAVMDRQQVVQH